MFQLVVDPLKLPASIAHNAIATTGSVNDTRSSKLENAAKRIPSKSHATVDTKPMASLIPVGREWRMLASLSLHHGIGELACTSNPQAVAAGEEIQSCYRLLQMMFGLSSEVVARPFFNFQKITYAVTFVARSIFGLRRRSGMGYFHVKCSAGILQSKC